MESLSRAIDGELSAEESRELAAHLSACAECRARLEAERALEARIAKGLESPVDPAAPALWLARAKARGAEPESGARARPTTGAAGRLRRFALRAAALVPIGVALAWYLCVPPFECPYLRAIECAELGAPAAPIDAGSLLARVVPPPEFAGFAVGESGPATVRLLGVDVPAIGATYGAGSGRIEVIWSDDGGHFPSSRRKVERDGEIWWIAAERGRNLVAFVDPGSGALCTLVSEIESDRLYALAMEFRWLARRP